ncbi:MAG: hypothetical protein ACI4W6_09110 [Acutalibacteraceae bacterium]
MDFIGRSLNNSKPLKSAALNCSTSKDNIADFHAGSDKTEQKQSAFCLNRQTLPAAEHDKYKSIGFARSVAGVDKALYLIILSSVSFHYEAKTL